MSPITNTEAAVDLDTELLERLRVATESLRKHLEANHFAERMALAFRARE